MYWCKHTYTHTCIQIFTHTHKQLHTCTVTNTHIHTHVYSHINTQTHTYRYKYTHIHVDIEAFIHTITITRRLYKRDSSYLCSDICLYTLLKFLTLPIISHGTGHSFITFMPCEGQFPGTRQH